MKRLNSCPHPPFGHPVPVGEGPREKQTSNFRDRLKTKSSLNRPRSIDRNLDNRLRLIVLVARGTPTSAVPGYSGSAAQFVGNFVRVQTRFDVPAVFLSPGPREFGAE